MTPPPATCSPTPTAEQRRAAFLAALARVVARRVLADLEKTSPAAATNPGGAIDQETNERVYDRQTIA